MNNLLGMSFQLGRLFGIDVRIHFLFLIWIAFRVFTAGNAAYEVLLNMTILFVIILLHELGHCFGARAVNGQAIQIIMWPLGGLAMSHAPMTPWAQFVTVAAGPAVNVVICLITAPILFLVTNGEIVFNLNPFDLFSGRPGVLIPAGAAFWVELIARTYAMSWWLLIFNMLPIYPMDGGQLFQIALWRSMGIHRSTEIACQVGLAGAVVFGLMGLQTGGILLFLAIFGGMTCWRRLEQLKYGMVVDERVAYAQPQVYNLKKKSLWERLFGARTKVREDEDLSADNNPNPGGWEARMKEKEDREAELDRILEKVSKHGTSSLSYVEQQTLQKASEERRRRSQ